MTTCDCWLFQRLSAANVCTLWVFMRRAGKCVVLCGVVLAMVCFIKVPGGGNYTWQGVGQTRTSRKGRCCWHPMMYHHAVSCSCVSLSKPFTKHMRVHSVAVVCGFLSRLGHLRVHVHVCLCCHAPLLQPGASSDLLLLVRFFLLCL
jgi:hypothetical protein